MRSFSDNAKATLHLRVLRGSDRHHIVEGGVQGARPRGARRARRHGRGVQHEGQRRPPSRGEVDAHAPGHRLPRREGRTRGEGDAVRAAARRRRSGGARDALRAGGRGRDGVPRHLGERRGARHAARRRAAHGGAAVHAADDRRRRAHGGRRRTRAARRRGQGEHQLGRGRPTRDPHRGGRAIRSAVRGGEHRREAATAIAGAST